MFPELINIVNDKPVLFSDFRFDTDSVKAAFLNFNFTNGRPITKSMLTWWAFLDSKQELLPMETVLEIEHIYPRNRQDNEQLLKNDRNLEALGNKALLESRINIRASDYRFEDKKKYYNGYTNSRNQKKDGTRIHELICLADSNDDFVESDIIKRNNDIIERFVEYITINGLAK